MVGTLGPCPVPSQPALSPLRVAQLTRRPPKGHAAISVAPRVRTEQSDIDGHMGAAVDGARPAERSVMRATTSEGQHPRRRPYRRGCAPAITGLQLPSVTACSVPRLRRCGSRRHNDHWPGVVAGNSGGLPGLRADARRRLSLRRGGRRRCKGDGPPGRPRPHTRLAFTRTRAAPGTGAVPARPGQHP